jgi:predicted transcriptional regulator
MEKWIRILMAIYNEQITASIVCAFNITMEHFHKYIQMLYDSNFIIIITDSNFIEKNYRVTERGLSVLIANNLIERGKKKNGKAQKNPEEITTSDQRNPESDDNPE